MYTHKKFFMAAGLSGLWYGSIELAGHLGWYWLIVVLLALPCVLCFGLWLRLEDERELRQSIEPELQQSIEPERRNCIPKACGTCVDYRKCEHLGLCNYSGTCEFWRPSEENRR